MGHQPVWNIWRIRSLGCGRQGMVKGVDVDGGLGTSWFKVVNVNEHSDVRFSGGGGRGGMTDASLRVCFTQVCSSFVSSVPRVSIFSRISTRVIRRPRANLCNSVNSCVLSEVHDSLKDGSAIGRVVHLR